jgi:amino acid transporter
VTLYGLGVTVGAGIYVLAGATAAEAGAHAPISFIVAAFVVAFTALSYAELSIRYPVSGGEAAYVEAGFSRAWLTTGVGLGVALSGIVSAAAVSLGAAAYLGQFVALPQPLLVTVIVVAMGLIAFSGISQSVATAAVITVIEILGLVFVIGWGMLLSEKQGVQFEEIFSPTGIEQWLGIGSASVLAFFAFVGFEDIANVAEEVKEPRQTMPRAILLTLLIASVLYIATIVSVLMAIPISRLSESSAPLMIIFDGADDRYKISFGALAVVATVNGVLIQIIMASRIVYGLADRSFLPEIFARVSAKTRTPSIATLCVVFLILFLGQGLPIEALAERTSQIVLLVFIAVNLSLLRIKRQPMARDHGFSVPKVVPLVGVATSVGMFLLSIA